MKSLARSFLVLLLLVSLVRAVENERRRTKRGIVNVLKTTGKQLLSSVVQKSALMIAQKGALRFLHQSEMRMLKEMVEQMEFERMQAEMQEKVLKAALMINATNDVYEKRYDCSVGYDYIDLTFHFGPPMKLEPDRWILDFFA